MTEMQVRFLIDADSELPHIYNHGVKEREAIDIIERPGLLLQGSRGSLVAVGQTAAGRYLRVIYRELGDELLVITAFDLRGKALKAYRRRRRGRGL
jgi:hypothetical protein